MKKIKNIYKFIIEYFRRCKIPTKKEIKEYYPKYLNVHKNKWNRLMHLLGNLLTLLYIILIFLLMIKISILFFPFLFLTPFVVYSSCWPGHIYFEQNIPATFKINPILSKICDWLMIKDMLINGNKFKSNKQSTPK